MCSSRSLVCLCARAVPLANAPRAAPPCARRFHQQLSHVRRTQSPALHQQAFLPRLCRHAFSATTKRSEAVDPDKQPVPQYQMTFTCKVCQERSAHRISKQGYHHGTVLISCPGCKNRHLITDHLKVFADQETTLEDILNARGELLKRGQLSEGGDLELWDDGTQTKHEPPPPRSSNADDAHSQDAPGASFAKRP